MRFGTAHPTQDLEQNTIVTFNVLEAMRVNGVGGIAFSSTGSVYGEAEVIPTPENAPFPVQTSLYGASKMAGEGLIQAYCEGFGFQGWIFRFVSILGERYSHGTCSTFTGSCGANRTSCTCWATASSASRICTCRTASTRSHGHRTSQEGNIFNLGTDEYCPVNDSIGWLRGQLGIDPRQTTPAATGAGLATARSSSSIARAYGGSGGRRSLRSSRGSSARWTICAPIRG